MPAEPQVVVFEQEVDITPQRIPLGDRRYLFREVADQEIVDRVAAGTPLDRPLGRGYLMHLGKRP